MKTVLNLLDQACKNYPDSTYISDKYQDSKWTPLTFPEVNTESDYIASGLLEYGFNVNDKLSILSEGRNSWVISEYAVLKIKSTAVPLSVKLLPEEILFRINHSDSKAIIISKFNIEKLGPIFKQIEDKDFRIILLDNDQNVIEQICSKHDIDPKYIITYNDIRTKGKSKMDINRKKLNDIRSTISEDDVVTISYTSGTSGNPKGILLTHLNYYTNAEGAAQHMQLPENWKILIMLPVDHSFAHTVGIFISCFIALGVHFVDSSQGPRQTLKNIPINLQEVKPDILITVPALSANFMNKIKDGIKAKGGFVEWLFNKGVQAGIKINRDGFNKAGLVTRLRYGLIYNIADKLVFSKVRNIFGGNLKLCVGGGALLDIRQQHFFYAIGAPIFQGYGLTEAAPIISSNYKQVHKMGTSGKVFANIECKIMDNDREMTTGQKGEIVIKGGNVMKGYYKNQSATVETIKDNWLYTGDMGYIDNDGFLIVVGREKALLISEDGEKYSPEEIEEAIQNSSELVNQVMIYNDHKQFTTAIITLENQKIKEYSQRNSLTKEDDIINHIKDSFYTFKNLPEYKDVFPSKWIPTVFRIASEPFSEENKMINSTLKMVRFKITETYQYLLDDMYTSGSGSFDSEHNKSIIIAIMSQK